MAMLRAVAGEKDAGRKLKYFVRGDLGVSYTQFSSLKMSGGVRVNGEAALANTLLNAGDVVEVFWPEDAPAQAVAPEFLPVNVVFESDDFTSSTSPLPCPANARSGRRRARWKTGWRRALGEHFVFRPSTGWTRAPAGCCAPPNTPTPVSFCKRSCTRAGFAASILLWWRASSRANLPWTRPSPRRTRPACAAWWTESAAGPR